jgi:hypothetical protein
MYVFDIEQRVTDYKSVPDLIKISWLHGALISVKT